DLVQVHVVGAQPAQAVVDLGEDRLAGQAGSVGAGAHPAVHLGGKHDLVPIGVLGERAADDLLTGAVRVHVGGVEEVDAGLHRAPDEGPAGFLVQRPGVAAPVGQAVTHAAQADSRHLETGRTEPQVVHGLPVRRSSACST